jgi:hypothetical protein
MVTEDYSDHKRTSHCSWKPWDAPLFCFTSRLPQHLLVWCSAISQHLDSLLHLHWALYWTISSLRVQATSNASLQDNRGKGLKAKNPHDTQIIYYFFLLHSLTYLSYTWPLLSIHCPSFAGHYLFQSSNYQLCLWHQVSKVQGRMRWADRTLPWRECETEWVHIQRTQRKGSNKK